MIDKLDYLLALAREQHFGRAAEACSVSQQALSAGIKYLENRLGVQLVQRDSRFQGFTPEGERVLAWARRIIADSRAMQQDVATLRRGLSGHLRIAAIPTALPMVAALTTPYRARHPEVRLTIESTTSADIFSLLKNLEADAGLTYLDNEPLGDVTAIPMYQEHYCLVTAAGGPFYDRDVVTWAEVARTPLCLLTPNMQNRRIIDEQIRKAGVEPTPALESNSMIVLLTHVQTLRWASVMPAILVDALGARDDIRAIPILDPDIRHAIGLVALNRDPATPMVTALVGIARDVARTIRGNGALTFGLPRLRVN
ncbi:LysR family transcriptional regulator [Methylobacterium durans]|uniref:LysR family transcriptional regulator n=1 Tax=Methylobacterium durans TaxID=2202825 RepID=UPI002AFFEA89|nr:LysR family transcriptional regulator [Methylobacterium durans]MEA1833450.1 LysR family transcriptional regulator [Methylobacterium durans]